MKMKTLTIIMARLKLMRQVSVTMEVEWGLTVICTRGHKITSIISQILIVNKHMLKTCRILAEVEELCKTQIQASSAKEVEM